MENLDVSTLSLPAGTSIMLSAGGILLLSAIIVMVIVIVKRWHGRVMPLVLALIAYMVFGFIFNTLMTSVISLIPGVDVVFENDPISAAIIDCIFNAIGFTLARLVMGYMYVDRFERKGDIYLGGIGLGIGEGVLYGITVISNVVFCNAIAAYGVADVISQASGEAAAVDAIQKLCTTPAMFWMIMAISCILDIVLNIALVMVVFGAIKNYLPKWCIGASVGAQFVSTLSFSLYDSTSEASILISFAVKIIVFAAIVYYAFKVADKEMVYSEE